MKIALASAPVKTGDIHFNLRAMEQAMAVCRGKADLIVFGESVLQGFDSLAWDPKRDQDMAVEETGASIGQMRKAAKKNHMAVCFGFIHRLGNTLYSSQIFIGADGRTVNLFHRVSVGWKEYRKTDNHYREGTGFTRFSYGGKTFSIGLCGDLWTDGRPEEMKALKPDVVLWPVWCDYRAEKWNNTEKYEYARQAALCGENVLLVNPFCTDDTPECAAGGAAFFQNGRIVEEIPSGQAGHLIVEI